MELDWTQESVAGVTLVRACLRNERATDRRVHLRNRLAGPVLPPRRQGVPEAGWDCEGVTTVVPAGGTVALGYACPAPTIAPPVTVADVGPTEGGVDDSTPVRAARELGDHRPPRAVLGRSEPANETGGAEPPERGGEPRDAPGRSDRDSLPDGVEELLEEYLTRIGTAEALASVGVVEATALLDANGGLDGIEALPGELDADARELRTLARTAETLADRAAATAPPIEALRRLS